SGCEYFLFHTEGLNCTEWIYKLLNHSVLLSCSYKSTLNTDLNMNLCFLIMKDVLLLQDSCQQKVLSCCMLELMMVFEEEDTDPSKTQCIFNFNSTLSPEINCPACEIYSLENSIVFYDRLLIILQKINANNAK
uniref:Interleukin n=1 Tax=Xiphophorus couchianus TaxID=32473 RepID=A0A3B5LUY9_9TELE